MLASLRSRLPRACTRGFSSLFVFSASPFVCCIGKALRWRCRERPRNSAPVFIVGAPRTGSTILYQALTNAYDVLYIDNTACRWKGDLIFGMWLSHLMYGDAPHGNFSAEHGSTSRFGGHAPSECGGFWYRWLPRNRHFMDGTDVTDRVVEEVRDEVMSVIAYFNKPLLFKNLNAGQRLRLLAKIFPEAKFVFIRRDPRFVVRSILNARKKIGVKRGEWWSVMPANVADLLSLDEPEMVAAQVHYLEQQIEEDLVLFPEQNRKLIHYQDLCTETVAELADWLQLESRVGGALPEFRKDSLDVMAPKERQEVELAVGKFPFKQGVLL